MCVMLTLLGTICRLYCITTALTTSCRPAVDLQRSLICIDYPCITTEAPSPFPKDSPQGCPKGVTQRVQAAMSLLPCTTPQHLVKNDDSSNNNSAKDINSILAKARLAGFDTECQTQSQYRSCWLQAAAGSSSVELPSDIQI